VYVRSITYARQFEGATNSAWAPVAIKSGDNVKGLESALRKVRPQFEGELFPLTRQRSSRGSLPFTLCRERESAGDAVRFAETDRKRTENLHSQISPLAVCSLFMGFVSRANPATRGRSGAHPEAVERWRELSCAAKRKRQTANKDNIHRTTVA